MTASIRLCVASIGILCAVVATGCGDSKPPPPDSSNQTSSPPPATQTQATPPAEQPAKPAPQSAPQAPPPKLSEPSPSAQLAAFVAPPGTEELQAGLKEGEDDLIEQGIAVLTGADASSVALKTIGFAVLNHKKELADSAKQLDSAPPANPYDQVLVGIAHAAVAHNDHPDPKALSASLAAAIKPLQGGTQCAVAYYSAARLEQIAGDKTLAKTYSDEAHRRDQP